MAKKESAEKAVRDIRRKTRRRFSAEEKIRIVIEGLRGEESIASLCRREGIVANLYYRWIKEFLEAGKKRLLGDTQREASSSEVHDLRKENARLKELVIGSEDPLHKLCAPILEVVKCVETPLASLSKVRATQRQLAPLQAAVWPDSRARTVPPNLSELCQSTRPLRPVSALRRAPGGGSRALHPGCGRRAFRRDSTWCRSEGSTARSRARRRCRVCGYVS